MNLFIQIALIIASIYVGYVGAFMMLFKGRQKKLILDAIPEEAKAREYGRYCGLMMVVTCVIAVIGAVLWMITGQEFYFNIVEGILFVFVALNLYLNKKYSGGYNIKIY